ncbi:MAG TPA: zf-HC2 domain-containing protein [Longimicrobiaceae bacterium]|nr:zf-HC2 domain-containing protein [Longimicrobiaceae bacterium]
MSEHLSERELNDYVDGLLPAGRRRAAQEHLSRCPACRAEEANLHSLVSRLGALPSGVIPPRDLRPGIDARRHEAVDLLRVRRRRRLAYGALVTAAALVLALTPYLLRTRTVERSSAPAAQTAVSPATEELRAAEARYSRAFVELEAALAERGAEVAPEAADLLRKNLRTVDGALREYRRALADDPIDPDLARMALAAYERRLDLLRGTLESVES